MRVSKQIDRNGRRYFLDLSIMGVVSITGPCVKETSPGGRIASRAGRYRSLKLFSVVQRPKNERDAAVHAQHPAATGAYTVSPRSTFSKRFCRAAIRKRSPERAVIGAYKLFSRYKPSSGFVAQRPTNERNAAAHAPHSAATEASTASPRSTFS